jgi:hypothetical protein
MTDGLPARARRIPAPVRQREELRALVNQLQDLTLEIIEADIPRSSKPGTGDPRSGKRGLSGVPRGRHSSQTRFSQFGLREDLT